MMTAKKLRDILSRVPDDAKVYVRVGSDDAWPAKATAWEGHDTKAGLVLFLGPTSGDHLNYPEGYSGAKEVKL